MSSLLEYYRILGVDAGAGITDVTSSYKRLCRIHHPDVSNNPGSEELMKDINIAYTVLREKLKREMAFRERASSYSRPVRRYGSPDTRPQGADTYRAGAESEKEAYDILHGYFKAIGACDYPGAYSYLTTYDKRHITRESFIEWRKSVARLFQMREFAVSGSSVAATVTFNNDRTLYARKFRIEVTEENLADNSIQSGGIEKLIVREGSVWRVFLGYKNVGELTRTFDERFEARWKNDIAKRWDEYYTGLCPEYDMLSMAGMRKTALLEIYRQKRYGCRLTFAAISVKTGGLRGAGQEELLRSAAKTINGTLRETDTPAYAGDGVFAILFVELRKKNAGDIVGRLAGNIRKNAGAHLGGRAEIDYEFASWAGNSIADIDALNKVLKKFNKKL